VHNNQRDGMHRQAIHRGRSAYEPNSLGGGCPFQAGAGQGFESVAKRLDAKDSSDKVRAKPEKFADHYTQARLFFESQTPWEQAHIAAAFRFELSKVTVPAVRERVVASLHNASPDLAARVAQGLGMTLPTPLPRAVEKPPAPEVDRSPTLSLTARPGDGGIRTRKIAMLVADGADGPSLGTLLTALVGAGAVPRLVASRLGTCAVAGTGPVQADASLENSPGFLFDALVLPDGLAAVEALVADGHTMDFIKDQYRHGKTILALGASQALLTEAGIPLALPDGTPDPGLILADAAAADAAAVDFIASVAQHRHPARESDPPRL